MATRIGFIGLGTMGYHIAGHLARAGHDVAAFNRTFSRAEQWAAEYPGRAVATPAQAAEEAEFVFCCVGNDEHLAQVLLADDGALPAMAPNSVLVDHTTASAVIARELYRGALSRGIGFLDDFERVTPLLERYARCLRLIGPAGSGQLTKMVNQICLAGIIEGLAEGLHFAEQAGLDPYAVVDVISKGAAQSWQMDQRHATMIRGQFDFGFAVDWMRKDLALALDEARHNGAKLPLAALADQLYAEVQAMGGQRWDSSSLIQRLRGAPKE